MELGRIGIWSGELRRAEAAAAVQAARELETLGFGALWLPGGRDGKIFECARALLAATSHVVIATGIVSIWETTPADVAAAYHALATDFPGRFLLGLGVSHGRDKTFDAMTAFLDGLDSAPNPVPAADRVLAALGPRMLRLARDRAAGAHPYNVPVSHTQHARAVLGTQALLAPEQAVILESDPARAREIARQFLGFYMKAPNYTNNFLREGFNSGDLENGGTDRLIDAIVAWGDSAAAQARVQAHLDAGANHVCIQAVTANRDALPLAEWRMLATALIA